MISKILLYILDSNWQKIVATLGIEEILIIHKIAPEGGKT